MTCYRTFACALLTGALTGPAGAQTPPLVGFRDWRAQAAVWQSTQGAAARLAGSGCRQLLDEFSDRSGQPLSRLLDSRGTDPVAAFTVVRFVEARDTPRCRGGATLAYTLPGSPVIGVCGEEFSRLFARDRQTAEITLIHEFLHSVGLGENPPTSEEITQRIRAKCGSSPRARGR